MPRFLHASVVVSSILTCLPICTQAHMQMSWPYPLRSPLDPAVPWNEKDYDMTSPLFPDGSNFACKNYQNDPDSNVIKATYVAGSSYDMWINGTVEHEGGSCQLSLSYDNGATFKVIKSMIGGCPITHNYGFTIPSFAPASDSVLFSWSWVNLVGNREMYQNCARVQIISAPRRRYHRQRSPYRRQASSMDQLPDMFACNVGNGCQTIERREVVFPDPGDDVVYGQDAIVPDPGPGFTISGTPATTSPFTIPPTTAPATTPVTTDPPAPTTTISTPGPDPITTTATLDPPLITTTTTTDSDAMFFPTTTFTTTTTSAPPFPFLNSTTTTSGTNIDSATLTTTGASSSTFTILTTTSTITTTTTTTTTSTTMFMTTTTSTTTSSTSTTTPPTTLSTSTSTITTSQPSSSPSLGATPTTTTTTPSPTATSLPASCTPGTFTCDSPTTFSQCVSTDSSGTTYIYMGSVAAGTVCVDGDIIRQNDGACTPSGQLFCNGEYAFYLCDQGGLVNMGPVAAGTVCRNGVIGFP